MSDRNNPDTAEGWKEIAAALGVSIKTAKKYFEQNIDPLPVRVNHRGVYAHMEALRQWVYRRDLPLAVAQKLKKLDPKSFG